MKYLTAIFLIVFGFAGVLETPAHASHRSECFWWEGTDNEPDNCEQYHVDEEQGTPSLSRIDSIEPLVANNSSERCEVDTRGVQRCERTPPDPSSIFADREDGRDGDVGGGDFGGDADRADASTSAE